MTKPKEEEAEIQSEERERLTKPEQKLLQKCESAIEGSQKSYIVVGEALKQICDERLHKGTNSSFDNYCEEKWGFSGSHARRLIDAAQLVAKLRDGSVSEDQLPRNEYQARLLMDNRPVHYWVRVWKNVLEAANNIAEDITPSLMLSILKGKEEKSSQNKKKSKGAKATPKQVVAALKLIEKARSDIGKRAKEDWTSFLDKLEKLLKQVSPSA